WSFPTMTAVGGVIEPRRAGLRARHAERHGKIRVREINSARTISPGFLLQSRRRDPMQRGARRNQRTEQRWIFDGPGFAAVETARQQMLLGTFAINVVAFAEVLVI